MSPSATTPEKAIKILIADDHPVVREGLVAILALEDDLKVVGQAHNGEEACVLYDQLSPDILILDLRMPRKDGLEVVSELMKRRPRPRIIVLTNSAKAEDLRRALSAGAKSYLLKGAEPEVVSNTIREVFEGKSSLPHDLAAKLVDSMAQPELSQRELQILRQMALGKSNKEIGQVLYISEYTVKNHVKSILKKLNAIGRTEAIAIASGRGLVNIG
jgi:two-component system NarL family response regulator